MGIDGSYYYDVARNISHGLGFTTNISLYHQGMHHFPHSTPIYPIWPRLLGYLSYVIPLHKLAHILPAFLYCLFLVQMRYVAHQTYHKIFVSMQGYRIYVADLFLLMIGLHPIFFEVTSKPYTEALSFLIFAFFAGRCMVIFKKVTILKSLEIGMWCSVLMQIRSQFVVLPVSLILLYIVLMFRQNYERKIYRYCMHIGLLLTGLLLLYIPQLVYLDIYLGQINLATLLFFDRFQVDPFLSPIISFVSYSNIFEWLYYKLYGFFLAFSWDKQYSYVYAFHGFQYSIIGLLLFIMRPHNFKRCMSHLKTLLQDEKKIFILFCVIFALLEFASIHLIHKKVWSTWNFNTRHAIVCVFAIYIAFAYLFDQMKNKIVLRLLIIIPISLGFWSIGKKVQHTVLYPYSYASNKQNLIQWIKQKGDYKNDIHIAMYSPQKLARFTENTHYSWIHKETTQEDIRLLFKKYAVDYMLLTKQEYVYFRKNMPTLAHNFTLVSAYGANEGIHVDDIDGFFIIKPKVPY